MTASVRIGIWGKHPAFGDFLQAGLSRGASDALAAWLDPALAAIRQRAGPDWDTLWHGGQTLRFRIGRSVLGSTLAGVLCPSRDKIGRDHALVLAVEGGAMPVPGQGGVADQALWDCMQAHLRDARPGAGAASLLAGLDLRVDPEPAEPMPPLLSAHHPEGRLDALLRAASRAEASRAAQDRSYWWTAPSHGRVPVWLGCHGLPDAESLQWLLVGIHASGDVHAP